jgi:hypothetical protein
VEDDLVDPVAVRGILAQHMTWQQARTRAGRAPRGPSEAERRRWRRARGDAKRRRLDPCMAIFGSPALAQALAQALP